MWPMTVILRALAILSGLGTAGCLIWATYVRTLYHPDRYGQYIHALEAVVPASVDDAYSRLVLRADWWAHA